VKISCDCIVSVGVYSWHVTLLSRKNSPFRSPVCDPYYNITRYHYKHFFPSNISLFFVVRIIKRCRGRVCRDWVAAGRPLVEGLHRRCFIVFNYPESPYAVNFFNPYAPVHPPPVNYAPTPLPPGNENGVAIYIRPVAAEAKGARATT